MLLSENITEGFYNVGFIYNKQIRKVGFLCVGGCKKYYRGTLVINL